MTNEEIGTRIKYARDLRHATLSDIAKKVGVAKSTIQRYEAGKITTVKIPVVESIAIALNVNPAWIVGKSNDMELPSQKAPQILKYYEKLNDIGKSEATKRVEELTHIEKYTDDTSENLHIQECRFETTEPKSNGKIIPMIPEDDPRYVNAAHAIDGSSEEDIQFDEDIMDGENF